MKKTKLAALLSSFTVGGIIVGRITKRPKKKDIPLIMGNLNIDTSNNTIDSLFSLELTAPLDYVMAQDTLLFKVRYIKEDISQ